MSIAAALPISQLTEDQAVEELARILDSAPDETDQLAFIRWKQANAGRAQQLEQHIIHLHNLAGDGAAPGPDLEPQDAPPHHLQPEPAPGPAAAPERKPVSPKKTPKERLQTYLDAYNAILAQVHADPSDRALRGRLSSAKANVKFCCKSLKLSEPDTVVPPPIPDPKPKGGTRPVDVKAAPAPAPRVEPMPEKAGPGPYVPPTGAEIMRAIGDGRSTAFELPAAPCACADDCVHPSHRHGTADLDFRDHQPQLPRVPIAPTSSLREIRKAFWALLRDMEDMTYPERAALSHDLVLIQRQTAQALDLIEECEIPEAG